MQIQGYLQRVGIVPRQGDPRPAEVSASRGTRHGGFRRQLEPGSYPEAPLQADALRVAGRVDLLTVSIDHAEIIDNKTGAEDPRHAEQLRFYALLWDQDTASNPSGLPLSRLLASYPARDVVYPAPDASELSALARSTADRVAKADLELAENPPRAVTGEHCRTCGVRSICHDYWEGLTVAEDPSGDPWIDYEGIVGEQVGVRHWRIHGRNGRSPMLLLRVAHSERGLASGDHLRLLNVR